MIEIITEDGKSLDIAPDMVFTIESENPLLSDELMPVPFSTSISFLPTRNNKTVFGYLDTMMLEPSVKTLSVTIFFSGVPIIKGSLTYDGIEDGKVNYTFSGKNVENDLSGCIYEVQGLTRTDNQDDIALKILKSRKGDLTLDFGTPMLVNPQHTGKIDTPGEKQEVDPDVKFKNYIYKTIDAPFAPAVRVPNILNGIVRPDFLPADVRKLYDSLAVLGMYSPEESKNGYPVDENEMPCLDIADKLPDCTVKDFLSNIMKILCASVWYDDSVLFLRHNSDILQSSQTEDWENKISDVYSLVYEDGENYSFVYADDESQDIYNPKADIQNKVDTYWGVRDMIRTSGTEQNATNKDSDTNDIFCVDKRNLLADSLFRYIGKTEFGKSYDGQETYEVKSVFHLVRCIPVNCRKNSLQYTGEILFCPRVDFPALNGERPKDVHIGILAHNQLTDKGQIPYGSQLYSDDFIEVEPAPESWPNLRTGMSIIPGDLIGGIHKAYAEWLGRRKQIVKADVNLTTLEVASIRLYRKVYFCGKEWLIKKLTLNVDGTSDRIECSGEFVSI